SLARNPHFDAAVVIRVKAISTSAVAWLKRKSELFSPPPISSFCSFSARLRRRLNQRSGIPVASRNFWARSKTSIFAVLVAAFSARFGAGLAVLLLRGLGRVPLSSRLLGSRSADHI